MTPSAGASTEPTVLIIGGGPAGLRAAAEIAPRITGSVLVVEREAVAGGIPRHSDHLGYGIRDLHRFISGPRYAALLRDRALAAGVILQENATVTGWAGDRAVDVTSPAGRISVSAQAIILATGARERPRPARLIPGDRGSGIHTTGALQNIVHVKHRTVGRRAVIVGAELVSWSAALTLRRAGCATVLMTTEYPKPDAYAVFAAVGTAALGMTVATRTRLLGIHGRPSVTGVEIEHLDTGRRRTVECDTVILTGDWVPDNELARSAGIHIDPVSKAPQVDSGFRTDKPGIFAIGNLIHPVDTADVAALDGAAVADVVVSYLKGSLPGDEHFDLVAAPPFRWVVPSVVRLGDIGTVVDRLRLWIDRYTALPTVVLRQRGEIVARQRVLWPAAPGRMFRVPVGILRGLDPGRGVVTISLE